MEGRILNILVVSHMYPSSERPVNGIFVHRQVRELAQLGHDVRVVSPVPWVPPVQVENMPEKWQKYKQTPRETVLGGVEIKYPRHVSLPGARTLPLVSYFYRPTVLRSVNEFAASGFVPDVINAHTLLPDGFGSLRAANQYDIPLVTTVHGTSLQVLPDRFGCFPFLKQTVENSEHIIVNSTKLDHLAEEYFGALDSRSIVPNGIPLKEIDSKRDCVVPDPIDSAVPTLVSVGNLKKTKGHQYVIRALTSLPSNADFHYVVIGDGPQRERLQKTACDLGVSDSVTFIGEIPNDEVFEYLWNSDIFVLPSYQEAFGIAYLEAMACELPVVACRGEGPGDFIKHEESGFLVPPKDVEELTDIIRMLLCNSEYRKKIGRQARVQIEREYTWTRNAQRVTNILQTVI